MPWTGTSTAANPARSMFSATASIMPRRMPEDQRLCEPSRKVVSTKFTSIANSCFSQTRARCGDARHAGYQFLHQSGVHFAGGELRVAHHEVQERQRRAD